MTTLRKLLAAQKELPEATERQRIREQAGLSIRTFANALGVSPSTVARWESGERDPHGPFLFVYVEGLRVLAKAAEDRRR